MQLLSLSLLLERSPPPARVAITRHSSDATMGVGAALRAQRCATSATDPPSRRWSTFR
jgi:hypothetical protein